jgi:hypothetical protein
MLSRLLLDFEDLKKEEENLESFKRSLIQAFPSAFEKIYPRKDNSVPEGYENKLPETDEELKEFSKIMAILAGGQKSAHIDDLIVE